MLKKHVTIPDLFAEFDSGAGSQDFMFLEHGDDKPELHKVV